jgi:hypothetical protein
LLQHSCLWLRHDEIEMNYMLNLAYSPPNLGEIKLCFLLKNQHLKDFAFNVHEVGKVSFLELSTIPFFSKLLLIKS